MNTQTISSFLLVFVYAIGDVNGHGRLLEPPSRSSMFRFAYSDPMLIPYRDIIQPNYDDNQLYCGGRQVQIDNGGKCGVCGDPYHVPNKENEAGGKYALGIITRNYQQGSIIDVTVEITAAHLGYFEFRLCPWNNVHEPITHECLNQNLLSYEDGETKWYLPTDNNVAKGLHHLKVRLPQHTTCEQCVLQWRYRTGNSWGVSENGEAGMGLGQQEEFYGCSDVSIGNNGQVSTTSSTASSTTTTTIVSSSITKTSPSTTTTMASTTTTDESEVILYPEVDCSQVESGQPIFRDCHSFYVCSSPLYDPFIFGCPQGTFCDPKTGQCTYEEEVDYCNKQ